MEDLNSETDLQDFRKGDKRAFAYKHIKNAIVSHGFDVDAPLVESEIAAQLDNMSRTPIREALLRLEHEGYLERTTRGLFVARVHLSDIMEFFEILIPLESLATKLFIERADAEIRAELRQTITDLQNLADSDDVIAATDSDNRFHLIIARGSMNRNLNEIISQIREKNLRSAYTQYYYYMRASKKPDFVGEHRRILEAIEANDVSTAEAAVREHLLTGLETVKAHQYDKYYLLGKSL
jgi:DNA-binding GntR family transcriptional regulator